MKTVSKKQVKQLWKKVCKKNHIKVINSASLVNRILYAVPLAAARKAINAMGVGDAKRWLSQRYMTLVAGKKAWIVIPEAIGKHPIEQACVLAHELSHVRKFRKMGAVAAYGNYFLDSNDRAVVHEAPAEAAGADILYKLERRVPSGEEIFDWKYWRAAYKCSAYAADRAEKRYDHLIEEHKQGKLATVAGLEVWGALERLP